MPYSESFVTVKESPVMSTEANFVLGNKMFLQTAAKTIFSFIIILHKPSDFSCLKTQ